MPSKKKRVGVAEPRAHAMRDPEDPASFQEDSSDEDDDEDFPTFGPEKFLDKLAAAAAKEAAGTTNLRASLSRTLSRDRGRAGGAGGGALRTSLTSNPTHAVNDQADFEPEPANVTIPGLLLA